MRTAQLLAILACCSPCAQGATAEDPAEALVARTFRVFDAETSGTGFLVRVDGGRDAKGGFVVLVTAAHTLVGFKGSECQLALRKRNADDTYARLEMTAKTRDSDGPLWKRHPDHDIAALIVELPANAAAPQFDFDQIADEAALRARRNHVGQEVWVAGFPAKLEANPAGWPVLRHGIVATHPLLPLKSAPTFLIDISSFGGDSGAPVAVFSPPSADKTEAPRPLIVGLITGMQRQTDKSSMPFEERTMHTPLGLGIAVQAPFIRETIEMLIRDRKPAATRATENRPAKRARTTPAPATPATPAPTAPAKDSGAN